MHCKACDSQFDDYYDKRNKRDEDLCYQCRAMVRDTLFWMAYTKEVREEALVAMSATATLAAPDAQEVLDTYNLRESADPVEDWTADFQRDDSYRELKFD